MSRRNVLARYLERGWKIVPLRVRDKSPVNYNWQTLELTPSELPVYFPDDSELNVGVILGNLVDIDLEVHEAILAAPWFLDKTTSHGRPSKRKSHWLYKTVNGTLNRQQYKDPLDGTLLLEIRGAGHQTMLPPSVHPSGELLTWDDESDPTEIDPGEIEKRAGLLAACTFFARNWSEWPTQHHNLILHLSGGLLRSGWNRADLEKFVQAICLVARDHEPEDRMAAVRSTVDKFENGDEKTTGWPSLVEILGEPVIVSLRNWLQLADAGYGFSKTDEGNALRLSRHFGAGIRYCPEYKSWYLWDGRYWAKDRTDQIVTRTRESIHLISEEISRELDPKRKESLAKWMLESLSAYHIFQVPKLARSLHDLTVHPNEFDEDPWLLNAENGTVDLRTGGMRFHLRSDFITKLLPARFDPKATAPGWLSFLEEVMPDEEVRHYFHKAVGYSATGSNDEQVFFIMFGPTAGGKSTVSNILRNILGEYATNADVSTFISSRQSDETRPRQDIARLAGKRFVTTGESEEGQRLATSLVKRITGKDSITSRMLYGTEFEHYSTYKIWMATNFRPRVSESDSAIWRRLVLIPFPNSLPREKWDKSLDTRLLQQERSGILNWIVQGAQLWINEGLGEPPSIQEAKKEYQRASHSVTQFLDERVIVDKSLGYGQPSSDLFEAYLEWCRSNHERPVPVSRFTVVLENAGFQRKRTRKGVCWSGLTLLDSSGPPSEPGLPEAEVTGITSPVANPFTVESPSETANPEKEDPDWWKPLPG